ncbi:hypothetical protein PsalMR5_00823 [Piscirickettsia salmonis]|nr:hypothetical protein [Piscirickettsia salmonis]QGP53412.1 hypothetical protein PsalSR1_00824 [Piscirickettsia salmonis]QGP60668.1 hypothetical protein PsalBI1_03285 [Piscirickettsia salmonis]QGP62978.1 hypothetical protein PsalMR5_00823 [Piscirickettsia salmonis]
MSFNIDSAVAEFKDEIKTKEKEVNELHLNWANAQQSWSGLQKS